MIGTLRRLKSLFSSIYVRAIVCYSTINCRRASYRRSRLHRLTREIIFVDILAGGKSVAQMQFAKNHERQVKRYALASFVCTFGFSVMQRQCMKL